jgi:uncharacterized protein (DUF2062 family)
MHIVRFKKLLLNLSRLRRGQLLRPLRHRLRDPELWSLEHHSVAKGAAIGVFFSILFPVAHILIAVIAAIALRANVIVAALTTFASNPLTLPFVYYSAYRTGAAMIRPQADDPHVEALESAQEAAEAAESALELQQWFPALLQWLSSVGLPTAIGVITIACVATVTVYALVFAVWKAWAEWVRPLFAGPRPPPQ